MRTRAEAAAAAVRVAFAVAVVVLVVLAVVDAYLEGLSVLSVWWDDQGYLMLSVRHLLDGHRLYDDIPVFYGPFYYLVRWLLHGPLGVPLTHDAVRLTSVALRLATAAVAAWSVFRLTRGALLGVYTFLLLATASSLIMPEAGHPQELGVLLVAALPLVARDDRPGWSVVRLGALVAALCMTKVNVGVFAVVAVWMALLSATAASFTLTVVWIGSFAASLLLPWALLHDALAEPWARLLAMLATMWIVALAASGSRSEKRLRPGHLVAFVAAIGAGVLVLALFPLVRGSSPGALARSVILGGQGLTRYFVIPTPLFTWSPAVAAAGLVTSLLWAGLGAPRADSRLVVHLAAVAKLLFGVVLIVLMVEGWGAVAGLLSGITPFVWLVLLPGGETHGRLPRLVLAWLAALEPLQVYPVPGSQLICGAMPGILCALVCLGDGCTWLVSLLPTPIDRRIRTATAGIVLAFIVLQTRSTFMAWSMIHGTLIPLDLPGAVRMRVSERDAAAMRGLVTELQARCTSFLVFPGVNSLYFWTGTAPPTLDLAPHQTRLIPDDRLEGMKAALERSSSPCVVRCAGIAERVADPRVEEWMQGRFKLDWLFGNCTVWERSS